MMFSENLFYFDLQDTLEAYPCGSDHTPSPMASWEALKESPVFESPYARLTSIAVSVEEEHTIAFIGDSKGYLNKVSDREQSMVDIWYLKLFFVKKRYCNNIGFIMHYYIFTIPML